jgi:phosphoribosyl-ATP pyrophosphohydrolase
MTVENHEILSRLTQVIESRRPANGADPEVSYVARLFTKGQDSILKKVGEEATELVMASKDGVSANIVSETADLWFHCMVLLAHHGLNSQQVLDELARREGLSGIQEKASRQN